MQEDRIRWKRLHREQRQSGLSIGGFCRIRGVSPGSFHRWRRALAADTVPARGDDPRPEFVELASPPSIACPAAVIVLEGGPRIELASGTDEAWIARLVGRLERNRSRIGVRVIASHQVRRARRCADDATTERCGAATGTSGLETKGAGRS